MGLEEIEAGTEHGTEAIGLVVPEGLSLAIEFSLEEGVIDAPAGDGGAVDFDGVGDFLVGVAAKEEVNGDGLLGGKCVCAFVAIVANWVGQNTAAMSEFGTELWRRLIEGCLRQLSGLVATAQ